MAGQTLSEIRELLAGLGVSPRRRFGQNFLVDLNLMRKVVAAARLSADDVVLEVGCGTGSLTELLLEAGARVVGVEIDRELQRLLADRFARQPRFTLIAGDALAGKHTLNPEMIAALRERPPGPAGGYKLVANLPYQIATPLIMELLQAGAERPGGATSGERPAPGAGQDGAPPLALLVCTIQKEVGERLLAEPGSPHYGPVSVVAQTLATVERIAILPPAAFWPRPKVESIAVRLTPRPPEALPTDEVAGLVELVQTAFLQRRKMLRSGLKPLGLANAAALLGSVGIDPDARPESVAPAAWCALQRARSAARR